MEVDFFLTLQKVLILFLLIVIGFIAGRTNIISKEGQKDITALVLNITMPATIFQAMQLKMNAERIQTAVSIVGIMLGAYVLMFLIGLLASHFLKVTPGQKDIFRVALLLSNTSFMGYPMIQNLLGEEALFYAVIGAGFIFEIVSWTLGMYLISRRGQKTMAFNVKNIILSPGILSIVLGLIFFIGQIPVPSLANDVLNVLSPATSPLAMIVVGLILSRGNIFAPLKNPKLYLGAAIKLLVTPTVMWAILRLMNVSGPKMLIPVMMLAMPTASYVAMFSDRAQNNPQFASELVFLTSLLSIVTIPLVTLLF